VHLELDAIGTVVGGRRDATDDHWGTIEATIVLDPDQLNEDATVGLHDFSHIEVVFVFHQVRPGAVVWGARRPRGRADWPATGILAQRAKARPNRIGVTVCELRGVEGLVLSVRGLDAIDGTPVLDIKPYMVEFGARGPVRQPPWASALMQHYW
jgi:tRNA-Thr(GGU) m(6)t(6)A37 methyltransferase TsaA